MNSGTLVTLLGSGSESPKDEALLLTTVSYLKKEKKIKIQKRGLLRAVLTEHGQSSQSANF